MMENPPPAFEKILATRLWGPKTKWSIRIYYLINSGLPIILIHKLPKQACGGIVAKQRIRSWVWKVSKSFKETNLLSYLMRPADLEKKSDSQSKYTLLASVLS